MSISLVAHSFNLFTFNYKYTKYGLDIPTPNYIGGMLHGLLFMLYIGLIYPTGKKLNWDFITILLAVVASVIPFGTFWFDKKYLKE